MPPYNLSTIHQLLNDAFDLEGLNNFCFFHFRPVYNQFQTTDRKNAWAQMLLEHADRKGEVARLLGLIQQENSRKYAQYANQLGQADTPDPLPGEGATSGSGISQTVTGDYNAVTGSGGQATVNIYYTQPQAEPELPQERLAPELEHILATIYRAERESPDRFLHLTGPDHIERLGLDPDSRTHIQRCRTLYNDDFITDITKAANVIYRKLRLTDKGRRYCEVYKLV